ncbi:AAA family ATPase, partial [Methylobacterium frigidaeris]
MTDPTPSPLPASDLLPVLLRIAAALERAAPPARPAPDFAAADAFVWQPEGRLQPVPRVNR